MIRKSLFWMHLIAGVIAGLVVLMMSVTGVLLMYERQIIAWVDGSHHSTPAAGASAMPLESLLAQLPSKPATLTARPYPSAPLEAGFGREKTIYIDAYTGNTLGEASQGVRTFFQRVTAWHRWFAMEGEYRTAARAVTGASNLAFLFLIVSGPFLWLPRKWTWNHVKAVLFFRGGLSGKARDFNWHNVIGIWTAVPLFIVVLTATVMSYPWANDLLYRLTGTEAPTQPQRPGGGGGGGRRGDQPREPSFEGLNAAWQRATTHVQGWQSVSLRLPPSDRAPFTFTIDTGSGGQPQKRGTLTIDRKTGEVSRWEPFESLNAGRRMRSWFRFLHTGEALGILGQTIAGIASLGAVLLVWTGLALAWRRYLNWRRQRSTSEARSRVQVEA